MRIPKTQATGTGTYRALIALSVILTLSGCKHYNAINFVTNTEFGVKVGVNAEKIPEVNIGYSRQEAARVPVYLMDGVIANRTAGEVNALLHEAAAHLETAEGIATAANQKPEVAAAQDLISAAIKADAEAGKGRSKSLILPQIKNAAMKLPADGVSLALKEKLQFVCGMIAAERARPLFHTEFQEAGKFIGTRNDKDAQDAYSVIGTFKGNASGGAGNQGNASMGIAQYFATGIAAQLLAEAGGAALISSSPNAQTPDATKIREETKAAMSNLEKVAKWVAGGADDPAKKTRFKKALKDVLADDGEAAFTGLTVKDEPTIKNYLVSNFAASLRATKKIQANTTPDVTFE